MSSSTSSPLVVRLHISGLDSARVTPTDLETRFNTFGQALSISRWPPPLNAVGQPQNFAYVTLKSTPEQIHRCMNLLSGTMWKGGKIRVAEAKKDWTGHYGGESSASGSSHVEDKIVKLPRPEDKNKEQVEADKAKKKQEKSKRRRANAREQMTVAKGDIITEDDVKAGKVWGWRITPAGHLLRPMQMRPSHPVPAVTNKSTTSSTSNPKQNSKRHSQPRIPPTRARNQIIDPARYGAIHLSEVMLDDGEHHTSVPGEIWVCEEVEGETGRVKWIRRRGNEVVEAEEVKVGGLRNIHQRHADTPPNHANSRSREPTPEPEQQSVSSPEEPPPSSSKPLQSPTPTLSITTATPHGTFQFQPYDPREDEEFSDGYAEDDDDCAALSSVKRPTQDAAQIEEEQRKQAEMRLLKEMFGADDLEQVRLASANASAKEGVMDTDSEEEVQQETKTVDAEPAQHATQIQPAPEQRQEESEESEEEEETGGAWWSKPLLKGTNRSKQEQSKSDAAQSRASIAEKERRSLFDDVDEDEQPTEVSPAQMITAQPPAATSSARTDSDSSSSSSSSSSSEDSSDSGSDSDEDDSLTKPVAAALEEVEPEDSSDESDSSSSSDASSSSSSSGASSPEPAQVPSKTIDVDTDTRESATQEPSRAMDVDVDDHDTPQEPSTALDTSTQQNVSVEQSETGPTVNRTRAALLRAALSSRREAEAEKQQQQQSQQRGFLPVSRFEPAKEEEATSVPAADIPAATSSNPMPTAAEPGFEVHMSTLKDMFQPQESSSGGVLFGKDTSSGIFGDSWLGDEELDEEVIGMGEDPAVESVQPTISAAPTTSIGADDSIQPRQPPSSSSSLFFFFPSTAKDATRDPIAGLKRNAATAFVADTPTEIQAKWEERKASLTQDYKRRHREAVKKRKRGVVVVRGAGEKSSGGKEMHLQRVQNRAERHAGAGVAPNASAAGGANAVAVGAGMRWGSRPQA